MSTRILSLNQEKFLLKLYKTLSKELMSGTEMIYQWNLQREMDFINRVLSHRSYTIHYDADRLNSLRNLYKNLTKGLSTSN